MRHEGVEVPSVYQLKPAFQRLLRPAVARLAASGVTANAVTITVALLLAVTIVNRARRALGSGEE